MGTLKSIIYVLVTLFTITQISYGASLHLEWDANSEEDLAGYKLYYGTLSGNYGEPDDVGNVTEYELSGLNEGTTYYVAITAYDTSYNESQKSVEESGIPPDTQIPTVAITSPTSASTYNTSNSIINIGGTASDNVGVTLVTWFNDSGGSGSASGTVNWYVSNINLAQGENVIAVIAADAAGNTGTDIITINYTPPTTSTTSSIPSSTTTTVVPTTTTTAPTTTSTSPVTTTTSTTTTPSSSTTSALATTSSAPATTTTPVTTTILPSTTTSVVTTTTTTIVSDNTFLSGTVSINDGDEVTYSTNVVLTLFATDGSKELDESALMSISNDNTGWSDPEHYKTTKTWTLSSGEGEKTVYVKFRDAAGNWMENPVDDQIKYEEQTACDDPYKIQPVSVTASSELFSKSNVIDGNPLTVWSTSPSFFWKNEFITLDLGETKQINRFNMYASTNMFGIDYSPTNFRIETSMDNMNWKAIATENSYDSQSVHDDSWDFKIPEAQYIRVYITKAKTFFIFHLVQIAEIEVYGCDMPENTLVLLEETSKGICQNKQVNLVCFDNLLLTTPGKPVITFLK